MRSCFVMVLLALNLTSAEAQPSQPAQSSSQRSQPLRTILFIGNSFTFGSGSAVRYWRANTVDDLNHEGIGGVPALFKSFAKQAKLAYEVSLETRSGSAFDFHLREKVAELTSRPWDVVVAHSYSTLDREHPNDATNLIATGRQLSDLLRKRSPGVELYVTATWSRPDMTYPEKTPWHGKSIYTMADDVNAAYRRLADEVAGIKAVNPVGEAFNRAIRAGLADPNPYDGLEAGKLDLWTYDHYHASTFGYYLEALVVFGNVTGVDPLALGSGECSAYELGISGAQAKALQHVAHDELAAGGTALRIPDGVTPAKSASVCGVR